MKRSKLLVAVALLAVVATVISCAAPTPEVVEKEVVVEKPVVETVIVEKEVVVEKPVVETVIVEKEVPVEAISGGTLYRSWGGAPESFNPFLWTGWGTEIVFRYVHSALIRWSSDLTELIPELAESWDVSEDGTVYTFHLRKGVKWHDGESFTAEDVEFTYLLHLHPNIASTVKPRLLKIKGAEAYEAGEATTVPGIEVIDDYTVKMETVEPSPTFLPTVAITFIAPKHVLKDIAPEDIPNTDYATKSPIGLGPYKVFRHVPDQYTEFRRNEDYFRGVPHIERVILTWRLDNVTMVAALMSGEIDAAKVSNDSVAGLREAGFRVENVPAQGRFAMMFNLRRPYLEDKRIRHAFVYAIDKEGICKEIGLGFSEPDPSWVSDAPWVGHSPNLNWYKYDPDKARALLEEAGWDFDREIVLASFGSEESLTLVAIQSMLSEVGIKTKIYATTDAPAFQERIYVKGDFDVVATQEGFGLDPDGVRQAFYSTAVWPEGVNYMGYSNPRVDELFDLGAKTVGLEERRKIYLELQEILNDECVAMPLWKGTRAFVFSPKVRDARAVLAGMAVNDAALHEWWLVEE